jgi:DNA-binding response OmpR family regulator
MRVLVIDDDFGILEVIERALKGEGIEVTLARNGRAAATEVELRSFDAIFLDPDALQDGDAEFHRRLRALPRNIPMLILSARAPAESLSGLTMPGARRQAIETSALVEQVLQATRLI